MMMMIVVVVVAGVGERGVVEVGVVVEIGVAVWGALVLSRLVNESWCVI